MTKQKQRLWQPTARWAILCSAGLIFLFVAAEASSGYVGTKETSIFNAIYNLPSWLRPLMLIITLAGSSWMVIIITCWLFARRKALLALRFLLVGMSSFVLSELAKSLIGRRRPFELLEGVQARENFVSGFGFPSGHTTVVTAVALILLVYLPSKWRWIIPIWIGLVALSRIYLGVHAPLDIVGGLALGVFIAEGYWILLPIMSHRLKKSFAKT
jgi:membrane-associated phospholipid phosphatase